MDNLAGTVISLTLLYMLCLLGCEARVDDPVENEAHSLPPANTVNMATIDARTVVTVVPLPARAGLRRYYRANGATFNLRGDMLMAPVNVKKWVEYRIGENRRALVILDEGTNTSLVIIYEHFKEDSRSFALWEGRNAVKAWVLRHSSDAGGEEMSYTWHGFLTEPAASEFAFELKGNIKLTLGEGLVLEIVGEELETKNPVPLDYSLLVKKGERAERDLADAKARLLENPQSKINKSGVEQAKVRLQAITDLFDSQGGPPARYMKLRIVAEWIREKPLFEIELL